MSSYLLEARHTLYRARDNLQAAEETLRRARLAMGDAQKALESAERAMDAMKSPPSAPSQLSTDKTGRAVRREEVEQMFGLGRNAIYSRVRQGLFPPPTKDGAASVWWLAELEALRGALMQGATPDSIRSLVTRLVESRAKRSGTDG